uniref:Uncharacterized protein n=1 Tax=Siphoviridae sp. ctwQT14 TaxID=2827971 RepID=A0A8S5TJV9_9CAUD|nr:MAG TPA: hypothetical protein [Siphoviridae sp. ctwQT14]
MHYTLLRLFFTLKNQHEFFCQINLLIFTYLKI